MKRCLAVFGPTASGKSSLALALAKELDGVIISADSMQIYRRMDVGTAKPSEEEMAQILHRMINICDPDEAFSVYDYKQMAELAIEETLAAGKVPIITGGTGLYFDALFFNNDFGEMEIDQKVREELKTRAERGEGAALLEELTSIDPETAAPLHEKDLKRILRGLEVFYSTGITLSKFKEKSREKASRFQFLKLFLNYENRNALYDRINKRVDLMLEEGLEEETRQLLSEGCFESATASQAIGYKELLPYIHGQRSLEECTEILKQKTRNYAKRQLTWFRRYEDARVLWMDAEADPVNKALELAKEFLR